MKKLAAPLLIACAIVVSVAVYLHAQTRAADPFDAARKALNSGSYDQLRMQLGTSTDPRAVALRAHINIDHGQYADALKLLCAIDALIAEQSAAR